MITDLDIRTLKAREVKQPSHTHTAGKLQSGDVNSQLLTPKLVPSPPHGAASGMCSTQLLQDNLQDQVQSKNTEAFIQKLLRTLRQQQQSIKA